MDRGANGASHAELDALCTIWYCFLLRLSEQQQRKPCNDIAAILVIDAEFICQRGDDDAVTFLAGEHLSRMSAGSMRIGAFIAYGARFGGENQKFKALLFQQVGNLMRKRFVAGACFQSFVQIGDVGCFRQGDD